MVPTELSLPRDCVDALVATIGAEPAPPASAASAPVHVLYGGAHLYRAETPAKLATLARAAMDAHGADDRAFAALCGGSAAEAIAPELARRVREKLAQRAVEKLCIDFEDGYGPRPDAEEDADAVRTATELAKASPGGPLVGIRIKALTAATVERAVRTLDLFVTTLVRTRAAQGEAPAAAVPAGFTITLPKISRTIEVSALAVLLMKLETTLGLADGAIGIELMVETPRALVDVDGRLALPALVAAAQGRCVAAHLGAYDLTASLGVTAGEQRLGHPACEAARLLMQLSLAGSGVVVVDGATTVLPTGSKTNEIHAAWSLHAKGVRHALSLGIYQGWDLHPAQLPARYGAVFAFFLAERQAMAARLKAFVTKATQATRSGQIFDDAATGQGLLELFVRGTACGALVDDDVTATGLTLEELRGRSFARIVAARSA